MADERMNGSVVLLARALQTVVIDIVAPLREDFKELRGELKEIRGDMKVMNESIQAQFVKQEEKIADMMRARRP